MVVFIQAYFLVTQVRSLPTNQWPVSGRRDLRASDDILLRHSWLHCVISILHANAGGRLAKRPVHVLRFYRREL